MSHTINFGIDLGTTNSAIALYENGSVTIFKNPRTLKETIPSVVAFKGDRTLIGEKASELLQRESADVFGGFKRRMGSMDRFEIQASKREISPIELSALVLKELKTFIQSDEMPDAVVITIPAAFDTNQSNATKEAGYAAGFKEVVLLQEPIAASLAYANRKLADIEDGKWIVYDFGGGTFDVALTGIEDDEMKILDHEGDNFLGGKDIDRAIVENFVMPRLESIGTFSNLQSKMRNVDGDYHRLYNKLIYLCEEAKITVSVRDQTDIEFEVTDEAGVRHDIFLQFTRQDMEAIARPYIERSLSLVEKLFIRNHLNKDDIKCILLVGGTTYIPTVRQELANTFQVPVNSSVDPTTAVVVGAAYFAGQRVKMSSRQQNNISSSSGPNIQTAYERLVRTDDTAFLIRCENPPAHATYRISRTDGGFDSGIMELKTNHVTSLPLLQQAFNEFMFEVRDAQGSLLHKETIGITHGKFSIHGQPLPHPIGIEVDDPETDSTFLDILFQKNSILPLRRSLVRRVSETIPKGSNKSIAIHVYEGDIDSIPQANRRIGTIEIFGKDLKRDLIKGSDVELTIEISESRDVHVSAYLVLTDQQFENTFSPSEVQFNSHQLLDTIHFFKENLDRRRQEYEHKGDYKDAATTHSLLESTKALEQQIHALDDKDSTDEKYHLEVKVRDIGKQIHEIFNSSYLTKVIEDYYRAKKLFMFTVLESHSKDSDKAEYQQIIANERQILQEGNTTLIKMKTAQIEGIMRRINNKPLSYDDLKMIFNHLRNYTYIDQSSAIRHIAAGDSAITRDDMVGLSNATGALHRLHEKENKNKDMFINRKTGLE